MQCRKENLKFEILQPNKGLASLSLSAQGDGAWARAVGEQCGEQKKKRKWCGQVVYRTEGRARDVDSQAERIIGAPRIMVAWEFVHAACYYQYYQLKQT